MDILKVKINVSYCTFGVKKCLSRFTFSISVDSTHITIWEIIPGRNDSVSKKMEIQGDRDDAQEITAF